MCFMWVLKSFILCFTLCQEKFWNRCTIPFLIFIIFTTCFPEISITDPISTNIVPGITGIKEKSIPASIKIIASPNLMNLGKRRLWILFRILYSIFFSDR